MVGVWVVALSGCGGGSGMPDPMPDAGADTAPPPDVGPPPVDTAPPDVGPPPPCGDMTGALPEGLTTLRRYDEGEFTSLGEQTFSIDVSGVTHALAETDLYEATRFELEHPARVHGVTVRWRGFSPDVRKQIKRAYHVVFYSKLRLEVALEQIRDEGLDCDEVKRLVAFLESSQRGFSRP